MVTNPEEVRNVTQATSSLNEVHGAYVEARGRAQGASTRRLRRQRRRWENRMERLPDVGVARLAAVRDELRERRS